MEAIDTMERDHIRLQFFGDMSRTVAGAAGAGAPRRTRSPRTIDGFQANICLNYGGRDGDAAGGAALAADCAAGGGTGRRRISPAYLYSAGIPDPELIIRPSGEMRLSNFLLWQCAYSELYFCDTLWPDFTQAGAGQGHCRLSAAGPPVRRREMKVTTMKQRILVAVIGMPALIGVLCFAPDWATAVLVAALCVIAVPRAVWAPLPPEKARALVGTGGYAVRCSRLFTVYFSGERVLPGAAVQTVMPWLLAALIVVMFIAAVQAYGKDDELDFPDDQRHGGVGTGDPAGSRLPGAAADAGIRRGAGADPAGVSRL